MFFLNVVEYLANCTLRRIFSGFYHVTKNDGKCLTHPLILTQHCIKKLARENFSAQ